MKYIFDNSSLVIVFRHYYYDRFPSFWEKFNALILEGNILSVREVRREIESYGGDDRLKNWCRQNHAFFTDPTVDELRFITEIYSVRHFQQNLEKRKLLHGGAFADPFVIAKAKVNDATVVTQEGYKKNAAKMPNICVHFNVPYLNLEGFLEKEDWKF